MTAVLDASAYLAFLSGEPGAETVRGALAAGAAMSAVNLIEVGSKYLQWGGAEADLRTLLGNLPFEVVPLDEGLALDAALLAPITRSAGLSLGDRVCLALAARLGVPALTADRAWATVAAPTGIDVRLLR